MSYALGILSKRKPPYIAIRSVASITYDSIVGNYGSFVTSYWKFQNDGVDQRGVQNATITGTPELNVETIVDLDRAEEGAITNGTCIAWPGTVGEYAQAAHNAAHKTANGTIVVTFQCDALTEKSTLVCADAAGTAGGLSMEVNADGSPRAYLRNASNVPVVLMGLAGDVQLSAAYTFIFKWGSAGLSLSVWNAVGTLVRRSTNATTIGVTGTSAIRFGAWHTDVSHHDGPYGRVIWLNRRISDTEETDFARPRTIARTAGEFITTLEQQAGWTTPTDTAAVSSAFAAAISQANANAGASATGRGVIELVPGRTYVVNTANGTNFNQQAAILAANNVEIRTRGKPIRSSGNQAIIQFQSWAGKTGVHNRCILRIENDSNFFLGWVTLHGNKNTLDSVTAVNYDNGQDGGIHNIVVYSGVSNLNMKEVLSTHSVVDGLLVADSSGTLSGTSLIEDCTFTRNRRQGMSMGRLGSDLGPDRLTFRRVEFSFTGDISGDVVGQKPGAGVDIEPDSGSSSVNGVTFDDCDFLDNAGSRWHHGVDSGTLSSGRGFVADCQANINDLRIINCQCLRNGENFVFSFRNTPTFDGVRVENLVCTGGRLNNRFNIYGSADTDGGRALNWTIINANVAAIFIEAGFPSPWNTGHSITIWRGDFNPPLQNNQPISTVTNNAGFPP